LRLKDFINDKAAILDFVVTLANTDDRKPVLGQDFGWIKKINTKTMI